MKIGICIPYHGDTRALFTHSLGRMVIRTMREWDSLKRDDQPELEIFMVSSSSIARNREQLVSEAQKWEAEWILWLDTDHTFPSNTLLRLLSLNRPVVGANYPRRSETARPSAAVLDNAGKPTAVWTTKEKADARLIEPVAHMGLGCCLVSMAAIDAAEQPLFQDQAEDVHFFGRLREAGFEPSVDHFLSSYVGHIHTQVLTNADSVARRKGEGKTHVYPILPSSGPQ